MFNLVRDFFKKGNDTTVYNSGTDVMPLINQDENSARATVKTRKLLEKYEKSGGNLDFLREYGVTVKLHNGENCYTLDGSHRVFISKGEKDKFVSLHHEITHAIQEKGRDMADFDVTRLTFKQYMAYRTFAEADAFASQAEFQYENRDKLPKLKRKTSVYQAYDAEMAKSSDKTKARKAAFDMFFNNYREGDDNYSAYAYDITMGYLKRQETDSPKYTDDEFMRIMKQSIVTRLGKDDLSMVEKRAYIPYSLLDYVTEKTNNQNDRSVADFTYADDTEKHKVTYQIDKSYLKRKMSSRGI